MYGKRIVIALVALAALMATRPAHGYWFKSCWQSNAWAGQTARVADINPGPADAVHALSRSTRASSTSRRTGACTATTAPRSRTCPPRARAQMERTAARLLNGSSFEQVLAAPVRDANPR